MLDICPALTHRVCNIIISINIYPKIDLVAIKISLNKFLKKKKWDLVTNRMGHPLPWTCCWRKRESRKNKKKYFEKKKGDRKSVVAPARVIRTYTHTGSVISWALSQFRWVRKNGGKEGQYDEIKTYHAVESWNRHVVVHFFESQFDFGSNKIKCSFQLFSTDVTLSTLFASHLHTQINNSINCPTIAKTRSQLNLKQVEMKNFSRSDVNRRRDAMDAPKQMILSFPSFCSFFFLFPSLFFKFPTLVSCFVQTCDPGKREGGTTTFCTKY